MKIDSIIRLLKKYTNLPEGEFNEQEASSGGGGASSGGGGGAKYPTVTKWSSGRKFGPTYNYEQKKWTSGLTRGKANTLL